MKSYNTSGQFHPRFIRTLVILPSIAIAMFAGILTSYAALITPEPSEKKIESVTLSKSAILEVDGKKIPLVPVAQGLRRKKVAVFWAKVYVAEIFAPSADALDRTSGEAFVDSLLAKNTLALRMAFVRDVSASQTIDGLKDGLKANGFDPNDAGLKPLFDAILKAGENRSGKDLWVAALRDPNGPEKTAILGTKNELQTATLEKGSLRKLLLIWFGKPADSGLEKAKESLLKAPQL